MNLNFPKSLILLALLLIFNASCIEDEFQRLEKIKWNPNIAAPMVNSSLSIDDLVTDSTFSYVEISPDLFITLVYNGKLTSVEAQSFIAIPNTTFPNSVSLSAEQLQQYNALQVGQSIQVIIPFEINVSNWLPSGYEADSVFLKSGTITMHMINQSTANLTVTLQSENILFGTSAFNDSFPLNSGAQKSSNYNLANTRINLVSSGLPGQLRWNANIILQKVTNQALTSNTISTINLVFNQLKYSRLYGYVPSLTLPISQNDSAQINLFKNAIQGQINFSNPEIKVAIFNSFGCPANAHLQAFLGISNSTGEVQLPLSGIPNPILIPAANQMNTGMQTLILNTSNSNVAQAVNSAPRFLSVEGGFSLTGNSPPRHFISDTSKVGVGFQVRIPMQGSAFNFLLKDTFEVKLVKSIEEIEWALLRLNLTNGFPIDIHTQAYFAVINKDVLGNVIQTILVDSVLQTNQTLVLPSAEVDANGRVSLPNNKITDVQISAQRWRNLENNGVNAIILTARFNTLNQGVNDIKLYSDYRFDVRIGAQVQTRFKL